MGPERIIFFEKTVEFIPERGNPVWIVFVHMKRDVIEYLEILFGVYLMDVKIIGEFFFKVR
jgi:hypothetical protein